MGRWPDRVATGATGTLVRGYHRRADSRGLPVPRVLPIDKALRSIEGDGKVKTWDASMADRQSISFFNRFSGVEDLLEIR